jgi:hypothetical protein
VFNRFATMCMWAKRAGLSESEDDGSDEGGECSAREEQTTSVNVLRGKSNPHCCLFSYTKNTTHNNTTSPDILDTTPNTTTHNTNIDNNNYETNKAFQHQFENGENKQNMFTIDA